MTSKGEQYFELVCSAVSPRLDEGGMFACSCCGKHSLAEAGGFEICGVCGWEDDPAQEVQSNLAGGANRVSLLEARENYRLMRHSDPAAGRRPRLP